MFSPHHLKKNPLKFQNWKTAKQKNWFENLQPPPGVTSIHDQETTWALIIHQVL